MNSDHPEKKSIFTAAHLPLDSENKKIALNQNNSVSSQNVASTSNKNASKTVSNSATESVEAQLLALTEFKNMLFVFAEKSPSVRGLVLLGSMAVKETGATSDLDILFVLRKESESRVERIKVFRKELIAYLRTAAVAKAADGNDDDSEVASTGLKFTLECEPLCMDGKTVLFVTAHQGRFVTQLKLDCGYAFDVLEKAKYVVGSEIKLNHLSDAILLDYNPQGGICTAWETAHRTTSKGEIFTKLQQLLSSVNPYATSGLTDNDSERNILDFVENFDNCCTSVKKNDDYRVQFYLFILRHRLVQLQLLLQLNTNEHVYLPKQAYTLQSKITAIFPIHSDPHDGKNLVKNRQVLRDMLEFFRGLKQLVPVKEGEFFSWCDFLQRRLDAFSQAAQVLEEQSKNVNDNNKIIS